MLNGDKSLLVEVCDSPSPVRIASLPGTLVELHCSSTGKVFLAFSKTIAAVGITASTSTFTKARIRTLATKTTTAAAEISANMGFSR